MGIMKSLYIEAQNFLQALNSHLDHSELPQEAKDQIYEYIIADLEKRRSIEIATVREIGT